MNLSRTDTLNQKSGLMSELMKIEDSVKKSHVEKAVHSQKLAISTIKKNSKYFFRYTKSKSIVKTSIGLFIINGILVDKPENKK